MNNEKEMIEKISELKSTLAALQEVAIYIDRRKAVEENIIIIKSLNKILDFIHKETNEMIKSALFEKEVK